MRNTSVFFGLFALLLVMPLAFADLNTSVTLDSPSNNTLLSSTATISLTFAGLANITVEYNTTGNGYFLLNESRNYTGTISISWPTDNTSFADGIYGLRLNITNSSNAEDNVTLYISNLTIDNTRPNVTNLTLSNNHLANDSETFTISVTIADFTFADTVSVGNGSLNISLSLLSGTTTHGVYSRTLNLSHFSCVDGALCPLSIFANDSLGNTNGSVSTSSLSRQLYIDSSEPIILVNGTNVTSATFGENITVGALWSDISLVDSLGFTVLFQLYDWITGSFATSNRLSAFTNSQLSANYTNTSFWVNGSDEGRNLTFRINLTDANGKSNVTSNLTVFVGNIPPSIVVLSPANSSVIASDSAFLIQILDSGFGPNTSDIRINASFDSTTRNISRSDNSTLFNCSCVACNSTYNTTSYVGNFTCNIAVSWVLGNVSFAVFSSDLAGNANWTTYEFIVANSPDIIGLILNGITVVNTTSTVSGHFNITNASRETNITWSINSSSPINQTAISFLNTTDPRSYLSTIYPISVWYNLTAGVNLLRINVTLNNSPLNDTFSFNITANIPLNLSSLADQYVRGDVVGWNVSLDGVDVTSTNGYVNGSVNITVNITNTTGSTPFSAIFLFGSLYGLNLRWNASPDGFLMRAPTPATLASLGSLVRGNISVAVESAGDGELFFNFVSHLVSVTINHSLTNASAYYQMRNSSGQTTFLLQSCSSTPTSAISASASCYSTDENRTILYLPRFAFSDRVFIANLTSESLAPNVTIPIATTVDQSTLPLRIAVVTPSPNATFCEYNLTFYNATTGESQTNRTATLLSSDFFASEMTWEYAVNFSDMRDGSYNLTVSCADAEGNINVSVLDFDIDDTKKPFISNVASSNVDSNEATISATANEVVLFTVKYGLAEDDLDDSSSTSTYSSSLSLEIGDLDQGTVYYYNVTACDRNGQCNTSETLSFQTSSLSGSSGGGGGGGGAIVPAASLRGTERESTWVWFKVSEGQRVDIQPESMVVSALRLLFSQSSEKAQLMIRQYKEKPTFIAGISDPPITVYRYLYLQHSGIEGKVASYEVDFMVERSWMLSSGVDSENVFLYRLENNEWKSYALESQGVSGDYYRYAVSLPGFSYFALGGTPDAFVEETDISQETVSDEAIASDGEPGSPHNEQPSSFVSALDDLPLPKSSFPWILTSLILLFLVLVGVVGVQQYKQHREKESLHQQALENERQSYSMGKQTFQQPSSNPVMHAPVHALNPAHDPMRPMKEYILRMRSQGHPDEKIAEQLVGIGWDPDIVAIEMLH